MSSRGFHTITLGCKLNQFDGAAIEGELAQRGYVHVADPAEAGVVIVNTCTVTHRADADARKTIRRVRRDNPDCRLLVTGCYAELEPDTLRELGVVDRVFGNRDKPELPRILDDLGIAPVGSAAAAVGLRELGELGDRGCDGALSLPGAVHFGERSRAFLKVQDGCRLQCSYCIIPKVRGLSRSIAPDAVLEAARSLFEAGYRELVLTGVNTGDYGRDLPEQVDLAGLLERLLASAGPNRIRLNSLEPLTITDRVIELMASDRRLAPHLQVPLQSGATEILRAMRRNYRREQYLERLERLRGAIPDIGLGADVIVGFPGETDAHFQESFDFIEASPLSYLHVFSWSPRPGTPAAELGGRVHSSVIRERTARLRALGDELSYRFRRRFVGERLDAVVLDEQAGGVRALTGNYIELWLPAGSARPAEPVAARVRSVDRQRALADPDGLPGWVDAHHAA